MNARSVSRNLTAITLVLCAPLSAAIAVFPSQGQSQSEEKFFRSLVLAAVERTRHTVRYDPAYVRIPYPGGDVPAATGVCTDEVIRSYRAVGIDLQKEVHEDMLAHRDLSAQLGCATGEWRRNRHQHRSSARGQPDGLLQPQGTTFAASRGCAWIPPRRSGDLGSRPRNHPHRNRSRSEIARSGRYMIVHNIGAGPRMEDVLFAWKIIGHYRYAGLAWR